jgi:hypothetical protein
LTILKKPKIYALLARAGSLSNFYIAIVSKKRYIVVIRKKQKPLGLGWTIFYFCPRPLRVYSKLWGLEPSFDQNSFF